MRLVVGNALADGIASLEGAEEGTAHVVSTDTGVLIVSPDTEIPYEATDTGVLIVSPDREIPYEAIE